MVKRNEKLKEKIAKERGEKKDDKSKEDLPDFVGGKEQGKSTGNGAGPSLDLGR